MESHGGVHGAGHGRVARLLDGALKLGHSAHEVDAGRLLTVQQQDLIAVRWFSNRAWICQRG